MTERITSLTLVDKPVLKSNIKETKSIPLTCKYVLFKILFTYQIAEYEYTKTAELISITSKCT